jgi:hypothetical protein
MSRLNDRAQKFGRANSWGILTATATLPSPAPENVTLDEVNVLLCERFRTLVAPHRDPGLQAVGLTSFERRQAIKNFTSVHPSLCIDCTFVSPRFACQLYGWENPGVMQKSVDPSTDIAEL